MMIIGISGKANSGKDTLADILCSLHPFSKKSFAFKLKYIACLLTGWEDQYSREGKAHYLPEWGMTVGEFQQKLGTDAIRNGLHTDAWVLSLFADFKESSSKWVISDLRFPNEAEAIRSRGGILIRINRRVKDDCGRDPNHPSEVALDGWDNWDYVVDNNHTIGALRIKARIILSDLNERGLL